MRDSKKRRRNEISNSEGGLSHTNISQTSSEQHRQPAKRRKENADATAILELPTQKMREVVQPSMQKLVETVHRKIKEFTQELCFDMLGVEFPVREFDDELS